MSCQGSQTAADFFVQYRDVRNVGGQTANHSEKSSLTTLVCICNPSEAGRVDLDLVVTKMMPGEAIQEFTSIPCPPPPKKGRDSDHT